MDLSPRTITQTGTREKLWLGGEHGTDTLITVTLDITNGGFTLADGGYSGSPFPDKVVPSGTAIRKVANNLYVLAAGANVADGHLFEDVVVGATSTKVGGSLFWHGIVIQAKVPGTFVDGNRAPKHILYR